MEHSALVATITSVSLLAGLGLIAIAHAVVAQRRDTVDPLVEQWEREPLGPDADNNAVRERRLALTAGTGDAPPEERIHSWRTDVHDAVLVDTEADEVARRERLRATLLEATGAWAELPRPHGYAVVNNVEEIAATPPDYIPRHHAVKTIAPRDRHRREAVDAAHNEVAYAQARRARLAREELETWVASWTAVREMQAVVRGLRVTWATPSRGMPSLGLHAVELEPARELVPA